MASIIEQNTSQSRRKAIWLDLTPMVDLGFILITFFLFSVQFKNPTSMGFILPTEAQNPVVEKQSNAFILIPLQQQFYYYRGIYNPLQTKLQTSSPNQLRQMLIQQRLQNPHVNVIVKPSQQATYGQIVQVWDELNISGIKMYVLDSLSAAEQQLL